MLLYASLSFSKVLKMKYDMESYTFRQINNGKLYSMTNRSAAHLKFRSERQTGNKQYYLSVMKRLRESVRQERPNLWKNISWILHHDNAPAHTSVLYYRLGQGR